MTRVRHEYRLTFPMNPKVRAEAPVQGLILREPAVSDVPQLAALMMDSYKGTIDYDGESIVEAISEVESYFSRKDSLAMPAASTLAFKGDRIVSCCLVSKWEKRDDPLIGYIMTLAEFKHLGLGAYVSAKSMMKVAALGYGGACAVVTEGNVPSERLVSSLGFVRVARDSALT